MKVFLFLAALLACLIATQAQESNCVFYSLREMHYARKNDLCFLPPVLHQTTGYPNRTFGQQGGFPGGPVNQFCIRWDGIITFPVAGQYTFRTYADDGCRLTVNGTMVTNKWTVNNGNTPATGTARYYNAGPAPFLAEYYDYDGGALIRVLWKGPGDADFVHIPLEAFSSNNCTTKSLNVSDVAYNGLTDTSSLTVGLSAEPIADVELSVTSPCLIFSNCTYTITVANWNQLLTITGYPNPDTTEHCCPITVTAISGDPDYLGQTKTSQSCRTSTSYRTAHSWGDPHMVTFDGLNHDNFELGDFYMTRQTNGEFAIQQRQQKCGAASCNMHVAVKFQGTVFYMYTELLTGAPHVVLSGANPASTGVTILEVNGVYTFSTPTGIVVTLSVGKWNGKNLFYLNVGVKAGNGFHGKLVGLTGYYDGNQANDLTKPDGSVTSDLSEFHNSWRISSNSESLFLSPSATIPAILGASSGSTLTITPVKCLNTTLDVPDIQNSTESPLQNTTTPSDPNYVPFDCQVWPNATVKQAAVVACSAIFNNTLAQCCASLGVPVESAFATCLCDYNLGQGEDLIQDGVNAFISQCQAAVSNSNGTCDLCPQNCNGNGVCNSGVCACDQGFSGNLCQQNDDEPPQVINADKLSLSLTCPPSTLTVTGDYFYEATALSCHFGVLGNTTATRVSNYVVTCPLPTIPVLTTSLTVRVIRSGVISESFATIAVGPSCCDAPCQHGGTCTNVLGGGFTCSCVAPYVGTTCASNCDLVATPVVSFAANEVNKTATFVLNAQPSSPITVSLASGCMLVSKCELIFTPENWNIPQIVSLTRNPSSSETTCTLTGTSSGVGICSNANSTTLITRTDSKFAKAYSYGDPHMLTFDGLQYDNFVLGDYVLTRTLTGEYVVQARQDRCAVATCNYAIVVRYYDVVLYVFLEALTGVPSHTLIGDPATVGATFVIDASNVYHFNTPNGMQVAISAQMWIFRNVPTYHLTANFKAGESLKNKLTGLLGNYDGNKTNEFIAANGTQTDMDTFIDTWTVPAGQNLFTNHAAIIPAIWGATVPTYTASPAANCAAPPVAPSNVTGSPLLNTTTPNDPNYIPPNCNDWPNQTFYNQAVASCSPAFNDSTAQCCSSNGVSGEPFFETCLCDYLLLQGPAFTQTNVNNFLDLCLNQLAQDQISCNVCPNGCNGNGVCTSGVCTCNPGFQGPDCNENLNEPPTTLLLSSTGAGYGCSLVVTVTGENFFAGSDLKCSFSGVPTAVAATRVSNFQVTCPLPTTFPAGQTYTTVKVIRSGVSSPTGVNITFYESCCQNPCQNGGSCIGALNDPAFTCACIPPFSGPTCGSQGQCPDESKYGGSIGPAEPQEVATVECPPGQILKAKATCGAGPAFVNYEVACEAVVGSCSAGQFGNADFPTTFAGLPARGTCKTGYSGNPWRNCKENGVWSNELSTPCVQNSCPPIVESHISWPSTAAGQTVNNIPCGAGLTGAPSRTCGLDGQWSAITNPCLTTQFCPPSYSYSHADWPATSENTMSFGTCNPGYYGAPRRLCRAGTLGWSDTVSVHCTRYKCPAIVNDPVDGTSFYQTDSGVSRVGSCPPGKTGTVKRICGLDGVWKNMTGTCI